VKPKLLAVVVLVLLAAGCHKTEVVPDGQDHLLWQFTGYSSMAGEAVTIGPGGVIYGYFGYSETGGRIAAVSPDGAYLNGLYDAELCCISTIAVGENGTIYFTELSEPSDTGDLVALNADGATTWRIGVGVRYSSADDHSAPVIAFDGTVLVTGRQNTVDVLWAVRPDGSMLWSAPLYESPCVAPAIGPDGTVLVAGSSGLEAFAEDGTRRWRHALDGCPRSMALANNGTVLVITGAPDELVVIDSTGTRLWHRTVSYYTGGIAIGTDGTIYIASAELNDDCHLLALAPDGSELWRARTTRDSDQAPVVGSDGTIYVFMDGYMGLSGVTEAGIVEAFSPTGTKLWSFDTDIVSPVMKPALGHGMLVVPMSKGGVFAFEDKGDRPGQWPMYQHDCRRTGRSGAPVE
jgi:outer membrane protein assembly factor BamB